MGMKGLGDFGMRAVNRDGTVYFRKAHNAVSAKAQKRNDCMSKQLSGKKGGGKEARERRFADAVKACKRG